jgi:heme-degrading monooxygenase HmoA
MVARATLVEVDAVRWSMAGAVQLFRESVLPALHELEGYEGAYVLTTPEGKALVLTFWSDEAAANAGVVSGHWQEQIQKFVTIFRSPVGRETYDVAIAEAPDVALV